MHAKKEIKYLQNHNIDYKKWDRCVNLSVNGRVYAYSWYLDNVCDRWDALVYSDYEAVMPLPLVRKGARWKIRSSGLLIQLGVFHIGSMTSELMETFVKKIPGKYTKWKMPFNVFNTPYIKKNKFKSKYVYSLDLINRAELAHKGLHSQTDDEYEFGMQTGIQTPEMLNFLINRKGELSDQELLSIRRLISFSTRYSFGTSYCLFTKENNLCAVSFVIRFYNRVYLLLYEIDKSVNSINIYQEILNSIYKDYGGNDLILECYPDNKPDLETVLIQNSFQKSKIFLLQKDFFRV